jgi:hypothetical protein
MQMLEVPQTSSSLRGTHRWSVGSSALKMMFENIGGDEHHNTQQSVRHDVDQELQRSWKLFWPNSRQSSIPLVPRQEGTSTSSLCAICRTIDLSVLPSAVQYGRTAMRKVVHMCAISWARESLCRRRRAHFVERLRRYQLLHTSAGLSTGPSLYL